MIQSWVKSFLLGIVIFFLSYFYFSSLQSCLLYCCFICLPHFKNLIHPPFRCFVALDYMPFRHFIVHYDYLMDQCLAVLMRSFHMLFSLFSRKVYHNFEDHQRKNLFHIQCPMSISVHLPICLECLSQIVAPHYLKRELSRLKSILHRFGLEQGCSFDMMTSIENLLQIHYKFLCFLISIKTSSFISIFQGYFLYSNFSEINLAISTTSIDLDTPATVNL